MRDAVARPSITDKRRFWTNVAELLQPAARAFEYGDWDLVRGGDAQSQFREWAAEIETGFMSTEENGTTIDEGHRDAATPSYVLATMMVLVER